MKNYTTQMIDAIKAGAGRTELLTFNLSNGIVRLTTAGHDIVHAGQTFTASGILLDVPSIKQQQELRINTVAVQISVVDQSILALFQAANPVGRDAVISQIIVDDNDQPIGNPLISAAFRIDSFTVDDDERNATMEVELSSYMAQLDTTRGIRTTTDSFRRFYPASTSFINSKSAGDNIKWGGV
jgi:hypothetical protein